MMSQSAMLAISLLLLASGVLVYGRDVRVKRLVGGMESDILESPYMVSLHGKTSKSWAYCGGTIISDRWVLTAAHCFHNTLQSDKPEDWYVRVGSTNFKSNLSESFWQLLGWQIEYYPEQIVIHPSYRPNASYHQDIALIKLKETIPFNEDSIGKIDLANSTDSLIAQSCTAYGWGCTSYDGSFSETLQKITLPPRPHSECQNFFSSISSWRQFCAGGGEGNTQSVCNGDSGGPLVCQTTEGTTKQVGIMSYMKKDHLLLNPVVLTNVSAYINWIDGYINSHGDTDGDTGGDTDGDTGGGWWWGSSH